MCGQEGFSLMCEFGSQLVRTATVYASVVCVCCLCEAVLVCVVMLVMPFSLVSTHTSDPALIGWRVVLQ